jgi:peptide/nickel transport system substrate-binding protein
MPAFTVLQPTLQLVDPHTFTDSSAVLNLRSQIYEGLVGYGALGLQPAIAEVWNCTEDASTWTFTLRAGARFHDGRSVRVADVIYSLRRASAPESAGDLFTVTFHSYLAGMKLEAADESKVRLQTPEPMADLLELLCDIPVIPEGSLTGGLPDGDPDTVAAALPPGTGPYALRSSTAGVLQLEALAGYWGGPRHTLEVQWRTEPDEALRLEALRRGQAHLVTELSPTSFDTLGPDGECLPLGVPSNLCVVYLMRCNNGPLADPWVRQALNYATDKQAIIDELFLGQARPLNGPLSDLHFSHDPGVRPYPHDPKRAQELLRKAGWGSGLEIAVHTPCRLPDEAPRLSRLLADQWHSVGISARLEHYENRLEYARSIVEKRFGGLCCFDSSPLSTFRVLREKLDSRHEGPWWQYYHNDEANMFLSAAASAVDPVTRQQLYRRACQIYHDEAPWLYLYQPNRLWAYRREAAKAFQANRQSLIRFR